MTGGNQAGAEHLAELDSHLESHLAEVRRRAQASRDQVTGALDELERAAQPPQRPTPPPSRGAFEDGLLHADDMDLDLDLDITER